MHRQLSEGKGALPLGGIHERPSYAFLALIPRLRPGGEERASDIHTVVPEHQTPRLEWRAIEEAGWAMW